MQSKDLTRRKCNKFIVRAQTLSKVTEPICWKFSTKVGLMKSLSDTLPSSVWWNIGVPNVIYII